MDLVSALSAQLKLEEDSAAGLAGGLLLLVEEIARERINHAAGAQLRDAVPELRDWQSAAPTIVPGMLSVGSLPPPVEPSDEGEFAGVLSRFGIGASRTPQVASLVHQFLAARLDPAMVGSLSRAMPMLAP
jgi:hypothetical protein